MARVRPRPLGSFVGRDADVARVAALIQGERARLVTLLGPPGMGKTRLALHLLDVLSDVVASDTSTFFCDLASANDTAGVERALRAVMNWDDTIDPIDAFAERGPALLVLDNFEQLVASSCTLVEAMCQSAPELVVIVTSRERLGVHGEVVVELAPLACPPPGASEEVILASPAVQLLVERARAANGSTTAPPETLAALARRLDGIPLALELAAARTRVLAPAALLARLDASPAHTERDRGATLAGAIHGSWDLLSAEERDALVAASVFASDFAPDAAEAVMGDVAVIAALRDKSLLHATADGRLALYLSIRDYAAARLAERGEAATSAVRAKHARAYAAAARAFAELRTYQGGPDAEARGRLARDRSNLLAALAWLERAPPSAETTTMLAEIALGITLLQAAPAETCIAALGTALARIDAGVDTEILRARILLQRHALLSAVGAFAESREDVRALRAMRNLPRAVATLVIIEEGLQLRYQGAPREAWVAHEEAARAIDAGTPPRLVAMNHACTGRLAHDLGDFERAERENRAARAIAAEMGDLWIEGLPIANLAQLAQERGRFDEAAGLLDEAIARFGRTNEQHYVAVYSIAYGDLQLERGRPEEARARYHAASGFFTGWLAHRQAAMLYGAWAALEARFGALDEAETYLARARRSAARGGSPITLAVLEAHALSLAIARQGPTPELRDAALRAIGSDHAATSFDVRFALRMAHRALEARPLAAERERRGRPLRVARDGRWFEMASRPRVELGRRASLRAILLALAHARGGTGEAAVGRDALLAAGWPGEKLLFDAAGKRLRVAIATLRAMGLRDAIVTAKDGYALDEGLALEIAEL